MPNLDVVITQVSSGNADFLEGSANTAASESLSVSGDTL